jgi:hypothetical protein
MIDGRGLAIITPGYGGMCQRNSGNDRLCKALRLRRWKQN